MQVIELLLKAWNKFIKLEQQHPCDRSQFCQATHRCQHLIMIRVVRRNDHYKFHIYNIENKGQINE